MSPQNKTVIIICGPTAVGKTALAIKLAQFLQTEIISADSRQCYKELNIGVAKPSLLELNDVKHHFINAYSIHDPLDAGQFVDFALENVKQIFTNHNIAIMVGGTGLYIKAFAEGMDEIPKIDLDIRNKIIKEFNNKGLSWLQNEIATKDPLFWHQSEQQNPHRLIRALEVLLSTGKSIIEFRKGIKKERPFRVIKTGIELPRALLYERINQRVDDMIANGLVEEVNKLQNHQHLNALQTVGYRELLEYFNGQISIEKAIENIKKNTRHYAKRQMTWFKKDLTVQWFSPTDFIKGVCSMI